MITEIEVAIATARAAGGLLREYFGKRIRIYHKGPTDLVTEIDQRSEKLISEELGKAFPAYGMIGEEGGEQTNANANRWLVDPLDGTTNYAHGYPFFSVSIALEKAGVVTLGVVYNPMADELFAAERGRGATLNGQPIHVSGTATLRESLLSSGFPYDAWTSREDNGHEWHRFLKRVVSLRSDGSAALDLCGVAAGRTDGYWELKLNPWDVAAGALIVEEAGGKVTLVDGSPHTPYGGSALASNGLLHEEMLAVLAGK